MDDRADGLVDHIYEAVLHPEHWQRVAEGISSLFGGSPLNLGILTTGVEGLAPRYRVGLPEEGAVQFLEYLVELPPWSMKVLYKYADRFGDLAEDFDSVDLAATPLYTDWMKPRGLAPIWPAGHMLLGETDQSCGGFFVFRREGEGPFTETEFADATDYVPHLRRATRLMERLGGGRRRRDALAEVLDRLPMGILLLDSRRHIVILNETAQRIIDLDDGFRIDRNGPSSADARENATLQRLIADALDSNPNLGTRGFVTISRPSSKRDFEVMVSQLRAPEGGTRADLVVAVFVVDPEAGAPAVAEILEDLYSLTHSEAEIVRLMSAGQSLEDVARARGITMHTARSHLKRAFSKTGTSRQGELVRLIVSGVGAIRDS